MIIPTNPTLLCQWRTHSTCYPHPLPKVPYVHDPAWRQLMTVYDRGYCVAKLLHRRELSAKSLEWRGANEVWDSAFSLKGNGKSPRDRDWDYLLVYYDTCEMLAAALVEIRCLGADLRGMYRPFGTDPDRWPQRYTPMVFLTGLAMASRDAGIRCVLMVETLAQKLLADREKSPWSNAFGTETSRLPIVVLVDHGNVKGEKFYQELGFARAGEQDRECFGYASWTATTKHWLPSAGREFQMVKWVVLAR